MAKSLMVESPVRQGVMYPEIMTISGSALEFGIMLNPDQMMIRERIHASAMEPVVITLKLGLRKLLDVQFEMTFRRKTSSSFNDNRLDRTERYRFQIPLLELTEVTKVDDYSSNVSLVMSLPNPPSFFRLLHHKSQPQRAGWKSDSWGNWYRQTDIVYDPNELRQDPTSLRKPRAMIDIGRWTTYRLTFDRGINPEPKINQFLAALTDYNIIVNTVSTFDCGFSKSNLVLWDLIDQSSETKNSVFDQMTSTPPLPFVVRYQLEVCVSQGFLSEYNITKAFIDQLITMNDRKATELLEFVASRGKRIFNPMDIFTMKITKGSHTKAKIPAYCTYSRKVTVTPTTVYYSTPNVETSNRVVREYSHVADRFLRVQFSDERNEGFVRASNKQTSNEIFTRIKRTMTNGIDIGDRHYEFLAFGNSQFREQGAFFFCPNSTISTESIRRWMGDFKHIKTVAKYAARLGQCFSTTRAITGSKVSILELRDIERNGYNFTDGVGKMSEFIARIIASDLKYPTEHVPSAVQFRLGGSKGILAVDPDLRQRQVAIRKSQYKFKAVFEGLEVIRLSQYATAKLNRQLIPIMSNLGVDDDIFLKKQKEMLNRLQRATHDRNEAVSLLRSHIDPNGMTLVLAEMVENGFMQAEDPFVSSLVHLWRSWCIKYLKEKAHILIEQSAFLLGCTDETQTLRGHYRNSLQPPPTAPIEHRQAALPQIFVQISDPQQPSTTKVIQGICLIGRNPSLHPGDLRIVNAVDVHALHHLRDVLVFPQTGDRDLPSMCSGGDLDGDDFFVIWDPELIPTEWNHTPMDFKAPTPIEEKNEVTIDSITSFFIQYIKNDSLPMIAHAHMAQADWNSNGTKSWKCKELAHLHSTAVDFVKSGQPAVMRRDLIPVKWPHFMEKRGKPPSQIYVSKKILGQLYDQVEQVEFVPRYSLSFDKRVLSALTPDPQQMSKAKEIKIDYDSALRRILAQHNIHSEFEVWSTFVMFHANTKKDYKFHEEIGELSSGLKERFRDVCIEAAGGRDHSKLAPFVVAMYTITNEILEAAKAEHANRTTKTMPLISFAWLFPEVLSRLVSSESRRHIAVTTPEPANLSAEIAQARSTRVHTDNDTSVAEALTSRGPIHEGEMLQLFDDRSTPERSIHPALAALDMFEL